MGAIKIVKIDGKQLAQMMISGAYNLYNNRHTVDELNVFPVPDGDTGTNMTMTVTQMAKTLSETVTPSATKVADMMSYATLRGARGNSGVILSQFFRGIAKGLKGIDECDAKQFANALMLGSENAYKAVMKPTEGTILTVAREIATEAVKEAEASDDITKVIESACIKGRTTLAKTQEMLPALKKAGVVDAGGQGWLFFVEGILVFLQTGKGVACNTDSELESKMPTGKQNAIDTDTIKYSYCTEFIVEKKNRDVNIENFRKAIETRGDCMLVIDDEDIVKVHIHTNNPGFVLEKAILLGDMINIKIDNMKYQHKSIIENNQEEVSSVEHKKYSFIGICVGDGLCEIFKDLGIDEIISGGQTMNPSTDDIINSINKLDADTIFVFPNNKNIIMAANQAKEISEKDVVVIPTKSIPQCVSAMLAYAENKDKEANEKAMIRAISEVKSGQITYAVRDTQIDELTIKEGDILGIDENKIVVTGKDTKQVLFDLIDEMADDDSEFITVYYGEDIKQDEADKISEELEEKYDDFEVSVKFGGQSLYYYLLSVE